MRLARRYYISGRVQGVGFRYFTQEVGVREGLDGWVCNLPDGRVEVTAEGESESLDRFERLIRRGPRGARVDTVEVLEDVPGHRGPGFRVR